MGKITKADLKTQKEIQELIKLERKLNEDEREFILENYNPSIDDSITERGAFFTPLGLAQDVAVMSPKYSSAVRCFHLTDESSAVRCFHLTDELSKNSLPHLSVFVMISPTQSI